MRFVSVIADTAALKPTGPVRSAAVLLFLVIIALGALLLGVTLVVIAQRQRRQRVRQESGAALADPWKESARRIQTSKRDEPAE